MDIPETEVVYLLCCGTWRRDPTEIELNAWAIAFEDADPGVIAETVKLFMRDDPRPERDRAYMPRPSDILGQARRIDGDVPPTLEEAIGYYVAGNLDVHPLVRASVESLGRERLDPRNPEVATAARFEFRSAYAAQLDRHEDDKYRPAREAIEAGTAGAELMEILAGEARP